MASLFQNIYCLAFYIIVCLIGYNWNINSKYRNLNQLNVGTLLLLLFIIFSLTYFADSDYFHYQQLLKEISLGRVHSGIEDFYLLLADILSYNYLFFRFFVWGVALIFFYKTVCIAKINFNHAVYCLFVIYIGLFSYARATLGMCVLFFGLSILIEKRNLFNKIFGATLLFCSYFLHHSLILAICISLVAIPLKLSKRSVVSFIIIALVGGFGITNLFIHFLSNPFSDQYLMNKLSYYTTESYASSDLTILGKLKSFLEALCFFVPVIFTTHGLIGRKTYFKKSIQLEYVMNNVSLILLLLSFSLQFLPLATNVFAYRVRYMAMIPICICLVGLVDKGIINLKKFKICLMIGFIYEIMGLISNLKHSI